MKRSLAFAASAVILLSSTSMADRLGDRSRSKQKSDSVQVQKSKLRFGILGGIVAGGKAHVESFDYDLSSADTWEAFFDLPAARRLVTRLSLDLHKVSPEVFHRSRYLYDISVGLTYKEKAPKYGFALHPGIGLGYGRISDETFNVSGDFFMVKMYLDLLWFLKPACLALVSEVGLVAAPLGRSTTGQKVSADFRPLLRFGLSI